MEVTLERAGRRYGACGCSPLPANGEVNFATGDEEMLVLPLAGAATVHCDRLRLTLTGRASVFAAITDFAHLPRDATATIRGEGCFALPSARARRRLSPR
ncbi:5-deoxy-glucuronate isomerase [Micromonospora coriariae]|uniref:5-deoxy-glucuronate isomerase n=1 Tax=Micromonospora coriariae TaxID=285665 RepID=UPI000B5ACC32|nr:5-deoxy-glucuronate isomerase [Micromonospora coriariae]